MKKLLLTTMLMAGFVGSYATQIESTSTSFYAEDNTFGLNTDIIGIKVTDEIGRVWNGGYYTESPEVTIKYDGDL